MVCLIHFHFILIDIGLEIVFTYFPPPMEMPARKTSKEGKTLLVYPSFCNHTVKSI